MTKNYFYISVLFLLFSLSSFAQENKDGSTSKFQEQPLDNLTIYPNPVSGDRVFINSRSTAAKDIEIFDVLGKKVMQTTVANKELNVTSLTPGVYIIKIKEGEQRATRKLIIK